MLLTLVCFKHSFHIRISLLVVKSSTQACEYCYELYYVLCGSEIIIIYPAQMYNTKPASERLGCLPGQGGSNENILSSHIMISVECRVFGACTILGTKSTLADINRKLYSVATTEQTLCFYMLN